MNTNTKTKDLIAECEASFKKMGALYLQAANETEKAKVVLLEALKARTAIADGLIGLTEKYVPVKKKYEQVLNEYVAHANELTESGKDRSLVVKSSKLEPILAEVEQKQRERLAVNEALAKADEVYFTAERQFSALSKLEYDAHAAWQTALENLRTANGGDDMAIAKLEIAVREENLLAREQKLFTLTPHSNGGVKPEQAVAKPHRYFSGRI